MGRPAKEATEAPKDDASPLARDKQLLGAKLRARSFTELKQYIQANHGWVCSIPGASPLRLEATDSQIADALSDAGHMVSQVGTGERLTGLRGFQKTRDGKLHYAGMIPVLVFEVPLAGNYAESDLGRHTSAESSC